MFVTYWSFARKTVMHLNRSVLQNRPGSPVLDRSRWSFGLKCETDRKTYRSDRFNPPGPFQNIARVRTKTKVKLEFMTFFLFLHFIMRALSQINGFLLKKISNIMHILK